MIKKVFCGMMCLGSALSSQAAPQGFDWTLTGFTPHYSSESQPWGYDGEFDPAMRVQGRFFADDLNQDGVFSTPELISFTVGGTSLIPCQQYLNSCSVSDFSYAEGSRLAFVAHSINEFGTWGSGWERHSTSYYFHPSYYEKFSYSLESDWSMSGARSEGYLVTPQTKFAISPVPEAQTWLMLSAGMLLLGAAKRRRTRKA